MWSNTEFQAQGKRAVVIGASQGVGADIAQRLYEQDCSVVLVARTEAKLKQQVARIVNVAGEKTTADGAAAIAYRVCDAAAYDPCRRMWDELVAGGYDADYIFCCAGSSVPKLFGDLTGRELAAGMTVNYLTAANAVHAAHTAVVAAHADVPAAQYKRRHVVLFSSTVASFPFIGYAQYAPAKAAVSALSVVLRQELMPYNYRVSCVYPGNFQSEGFDEEQKTKPDITKKIEGPSTPISSMRCCDMVLAQLARGYDSVYTDTIGWVLASSALGVFPRSWGVLQVIVSFLFSLVAPVAMLFINSDIRNSFKEKKK